MRAVCIYVELQTISNLVVAVEAPIRGAPSTHYMSIRVYETLTIIIMQLIDVIIDSTENRLCATLRQNQLDGWHMTGKDELMGYRCGGFRPHTTVVIADAISQRNKCEC